MNERIIDKLEQSIDIITAIMLEEFQENVPFYQEIKGDFREDVKRQIRRINRDFVSYLREDRKIFQDYVSALGRLAVDRESQGFELKDFINVIHDGKRIGWTYMRENLACEGSQEDLLELMEALDSYCDEIVSPLTGAYLDHQRESIADFNRLLNQFRVILDRGELLERIANTACESMGFERAVFYLYERDALLPASAVSLRDENWGKIYLEPMRHYPISPFGLSLESKAFFRPAIVTAHKGEYASSSLAIIKPMPEAPFALVPINPKGSPRGLLYLESGPEQQEITHWELELLQIYADTVGLALENARLYRDVVMKGRALDHLMSRVNTAHEEERARIARELHDSIAQSLLKIIYSAGFALDFISDEPGLAGEEIVEVQDQAKECMQELRAIIGNLRPSSLEILGLQETIRRYAEHFEEEYAISTSVELNGMENLTKAAELAVFRILQEALTNVRKHSQADAAWINSREKDGQLILTIEDNGRGFDLTAVEAEQQRGRHLGLLAMRERAELMGGDFTVQSFLGRGTLISIKLPLMAKERETG
jgi:signal transduction histidine kinase